MSVSGGRIVPCRLRPDVIRRLNRVRLWLSANGFGPCRRLLVATAGGDGRRRGMVEAVWRFSARCCRLAWPRAGTRWHPRLGRAGLMTSSPPAIPWSRAALPTTCAAGSWRLGRRVRRHDPVGSLLAGLAGWIGVPGPSLAAASVCLLAAAVSQRAFRPRPPDRLSAVSLRPSPFWPPLPGRSMIHMYHKPTGSSPWPGALAARWRCVHFDAPMNTIPDSDQVTAFHVTATSSARPTTTARRWTCYCAPQGRPRDAGHASASTMPARQSKLSLLEPSGDRHLRHVQPRPAHGRCHEQFSREVYHYTAK